MNPSNDVDALITRALRNPRMELLDENFVAETVARAEAQTDARSDGVERWLQRGLFAVLVAAAAVALVLLGGDRLVKEMAVGQAAHWALVLITCLAVSLPAHRWTESRTKPG